MARLSSSRCRHIDATKGLEVPAVTLLRFPEHSSHNEFSEGILVRDGNMYKKGDKAWLVNSPYHRFLVGEILVSILWPNLHIVQLAGLDHGLILINGGHVPRPFELSEVGCEILQHHCFPNHF